MHFFDGRSQKKKRRMTYAAVNVFPTIQVIFRKIHHQNELSKTVPQLCLSEDRSVDCNRIFLVVYTLGQFDPSHFFFTKYHRHTCFPIILDDQLKLTQCFNVVANLRFVDAGFIRKARKNWVTRRNYSIATPIAKYQSYIIIYFSRVTRGHKILFVWFQRKIPLSLALAPSLARFVHKQNSSLVFAGAAQVTCICNSGAVRSCHSHSPRTEPEQKLKVS